MKLKTLLLFLVICQICSVVEGRECKDRIYSWICERMVRWDSTKTCSHPFWKPIEDFLCCKTCSDHGITIPAAPTTKITSNPSAQPTTTTKLNPKQTTELTMKQTSELTMKQRTEQTMNETTEQTMKQTTERIMKQTTEQTMNETTEQTMKQMTVQTMNETTEQTMKQMTGQTMNETTEQTMKQTTEQTMNETTEQTMNETTEQTMNETTEQTMNETTEQTMNETTEQIMNETTEQAIIETTELTMNQTTEPTMKQTTEQTMKQRTEKTMNETTEQTIKQTTEQTMKPSTKPTTKPTSKLTTKQTTKPTIKPTTTRKTTTTKKTTTVPPIQYKVMLIGGKPGKLTNLEEFHPDQPAKSKVSSVKFDVGRRSFATGVFLSGEYNRILVAGGVKENQKHRTSSVYDEKWNQVYAGPPMNYKHGWTAGAVVGNRFFVCGGADDSTYYTGNCEYFQSNKWQWTPSKGLSPGRMGAVAVGLNNHLYMIGGRSSSGVMRTTQLYDHTTGRWYDAGNTVKPRYKAGATVLNGNIYVCGGWELQGNSWILSSSCEMYKPEEDKWYQIAGMNNGRAGFSMVTYKNKVMALGGSEVVGVGDSVEVYDPQLRFWKMLEAKLKGPRQDFSAVVIKA